MTLLAASDSGRAGALGFLVVLLLLVITALLIRNMNARLRRLPKSFDPPEPEEPQEKADE
jgi:hypothetical protein